MIASVILPSYNRAEGLRLTLTALAGQNAGPDAFEVIVVDDGSTDGTVEWLQAQARAGARRPRPYDLTVLWQHNRGPGAARNLGNWLAAGELLIFLDADMIPDPGLVAAYASAFAAQPDAIHIGRILAWPGAYETLFDRVTQAERTHDLGPTPRQLAFYHLASGNFAIGAETFRRLGGFDEALRMTEDTDLGYRAEQADVPFQYCPEAAGYHNHPKTLQQRCASVEGAAFWTARLLDKHPAMAHRLPIYQDSLPVAWGRDPVALIARKLGRRALALAPARKIMHCLIRQSETRWPNPRLLRSLYYKLMSGYRVSGFREGRVALAVYEKRRSSRSPKPA